MTRIVTKILMALVICHSGEIYGQAKKKQSNIYPYRKKDKWGYCDSNKKILIQPIYESADCFGDDNYAVVKLNSKYGLINRSGILKCCSIVVVNKRDRTKRSL